MRDSGSCGVRAGFVRGSCDTRGSDRRRAQPGGSALAGQPSRDAAGTPGRRRPRSHADEGVTRFAFSGRPGRTRVDLGRGLGWSFGRAGWRLAGFRACPAGDWRGFGRERGLAKFRARSSGTRPIETRAPPMPPKGPQKSHYGQGVTFRRGDSFARTPGRRDASIQRHARQRQRQRQRQRSLPASRAGGRRASEPASQRDTRTRARAPNQRTHPTTSPRASANPAHSRNHRPAHTSAEPAHSPNHQPARERQPSTLAQPQARAHERRTSALTQPPARARAPTQHTRATTGPHKQAPTSALTQPPARTGEHPSGRPPNLRKPARGMPTAGGLAITAPAAREAPSPETRGAASPPLPAARRADDRRTVPAAAPRLRPGLATRRLRHHAEPVVPPPAGLEPGPEPGPKPEPEPEPNRTGTPSALASTDPLPQGGRYR
ncbi:hypothetical protein HNR73_004491 [Phytomonospora endophytica]|uniref:Uncharacterized protein n=1 Tax=Phytomonospora endophytica TaxID=714109 RepID=A0A841FXC5_9ACTN|nr:hypothetical protein [Phytomonospora endophytica]